MSKRVGGIKGCKYKTSSWHLNRFPDADNIGLKKNQTAPRPSEHPPVMGEKCQNVLVVQSHAMCYPMNY